VPEMTELIGVYHADGGVVGELAYLLGKARGAAHCGLCDITHGPLRRKRDWNEFAAALPVPFRLVHLNEREPEVESASRGRTPCVLARTTQGIILLVGPAELDRCDGEVDRFKRSLAAALDSHGLGAAGA
jgi:hypothetical protein